MSKEFIVYHKGDRGKSWTFWRNMQKMKNLYQEDCNQPDYEVFEFSKWLEVNFGIKLFFDPHGNIIQDYAIVDEKKYLFYKLKHE